MSFLLFPGRHLLQTISQDHYLRSVVKASTDRRPLLRGTQHELSTPIDTIVFAITSANHQFTRYNPIPFHIRAIGIDRFASHFARDLNVQVRIFGIPHYGPTPHFASYLLKEIVEQTEGDLDLSPENSVVVSSTRAVVAMFRKLGFSVLPAEASVSPQPLTPQQLLAGMMQLGESWSLSPDLRSQIAPTTVALWRDFPEVPRRIFRLWNDPLLNNEGSLTSTRNYSTYAQAMGNDTVTELKYADIKAHILPGRIVDEGCADGALLVRIAANFSDSDLIGIEITGELLSRCLERQRAGEFGDAFIFFHQRNLTNPIFRPNSIHTTICNATLHELWSYNQREVTVLAYLREKLRQLAPGGRLIIRDVVGPENADEQIYMWLRKDDGASGDASQENVEVASLSSFARFFRFVQEFLPQRRSEPGSDVISYRVETIDDIDYIVTSLRLATEFITKKDYVVNWASEMHEEFAYWSFGKWKEVVGKIGFLVKEDSRVYTNQWIVENRWQQKVALFKRSGEQLSPHSYPPTTLLLVTEKPLSPLP